MDADVTAPLERLRDDLRSVRLELHVPGAEEARRARGDVVAQVDDYLLPRLRQMDAPALIVVGRIVWEKESAPALRRLAGRQGRDRGRAC